MAQLKRSTTVPVAQESVDEPAAAVVAAKKSRGKKREAKQVAAAEVAPVEGVAVTKAKRTRAATAYNEFVKKAYKSAEVQALAPKLRFQKIAELHRIEKERSKK